jgi:hypothetical protein
MGSPLCEIEFKRSPAAFFSVWSLEITGNRTQMETIDHG